MNNAGASAFRELAKVVRTAFLLHYIDNMALRKTINAAINLSKQFNDITKWHFFQ